MSLSLASLLPASYLQGPQEDTIMTYDFQDHCAIREDVNRGRSCIPVWFYLWRWLLTCRVSESPKRSHQGSLVLKANSGLDGSKRNSQEILFWGLSTYWHEVRWKPNEVGPWFKLCTCKLVTYWTRGGHPCLPCQVQPTSKLMVVIYLFCLAFVCFGRSRPEALEFMQILE